MKSHDAHRRCALKAVSLGIALAYTSSFASLAAAAAVAPAEITRALKNVRMLGQSRLVVFGFNIYDAKLWVEPDFVAANYGTESLALELRYLRNFTGTSIAERSLKEMRRLGEVSDEKASQWLVQMKQTFPDVKKGDQLIGIHRPDGSAQFILNNKPMGEVRDEEFTRLFFGIWLSPRTSEPKMRSELTGIAIGAKR
jgi:Chalcone isomerase-like